MIAPDTIFFSKDTKIGKNVIIEPYVVIGEKVNIQNNSLSSINVITNESNQLIVSYEKSKLNIGDLIQYINKQNIKIEDISTDDGDLEDVFIRLTKN